MGDEGCKVVCESLRNNSSLGSLNLAANSAGKVCLAMLLIYVLLEEENRSCAGWGVKGSRRGVKGIVHCTCVWPKIRVGQNHIYTVYIRYFWQGNNQIYGHIRCIYMVLANPTLVCGLKCMPDTTLSCTAVGSHTSHSPV